MEFSERKQNSRKLKLALVLVTIAALFYAAAEFYFTPAYEETKTSITETSAVAQKITSTMTEAVSMEAEVEASGKVFQNLATEKDSYIELLGVMAQENTLKINKMTADDVVQEGYLYTMKVQLELQGQLYNVKNFIQQMYDDPTVSRINSFSYRLQDKTNRSLPWMARDIDNLTLIPWWGAEEDVTNKKGKLEIDADSLMSHGIALCYVEVEFYGTGG